MINIYMFDRLLQILDSKNNKMKTEPTRNLHDC